MPSHLPLFTLFIKVGKYYKSLPGQESRLPGLSANANGQQVSERYGARYAHAHARSDSTHEPASPLTTRRFVLLLV